MSENPLANLLPGDPERVRAWLRKLDRRVKRLLDTLTPAMDADALSERGRRHVMAGVAREADAVLESLAAPLDELTPAVRRRLLPAIAELADSVMAVKADAVSGKLLLETVKRIGVALRAAKSELCDLLELAGLATGTGAAGAPADGTPWPEYMSAADLADRLRLPRESTRKKLQRLAKKYPDCAIDNEAPRKGESRRLYRTEDVRPFFT